MRRIRAADARPPEQIRLVRAEVPVALAMERLADGDAARDQIFSRSLDVGDDQVQALGGAGAAAVTFLPKMTEHPEPGGVNWITR